MKKISKTRLLIFIAVSLIVALVAGTVGFLCYNNSKPINQAKKIVSKMSTDEKIGQILMLTFRQWKNDASSEDVQNVTALNDTLRCGFFRIGGKRPHSWLWCRNDARCLHPCRRLRYDLCAYQTQAVLHRHDRTFGCCDDFPLGV